MSSFKPRSVLPWRKPGDTPTIPVLNGLSIYDSIFLGLDTRGKPVYLPLMYRNILLGGEPGSGKSVGLGNIVAYAALCLDVDLILLDGKIVELLPYAPVAKDFANNMRSALHVLRDLQADMEKRYLHLARTGRKKITRDDGYRATVLAVDELAYFLATTGTPTQQDDFFIVLRDLVARGRAVGIIVVAATQRPSADIVKTSLRDQFSWRLAFRCTTDTSSDIILGNGWAGEGYSAKDIPPEELGQGLLLAEGGTPRRIKTAFLQDQHVTTLVARAVHLRRLASTAGTTDPTVLPDSSTGGDTR